jgi:hypothetical protein
MFSYVAINLAIALIGARVAFTRRDGPTAVGAATPHLIERGKCLVKVPGEWTARPFDGATKLLARQAG